MKYRITQAVKQAHGAQMWTVEANSKEEALELHEAGKSDFEAEEVEVVHLEDARLDDIEEVEPPPTATPVARERGDE